MNSSVIDSASINSVKDALQKNLINALNRFQNTAFEKEFLDRSESIDVDSKPNSFFGFGIGTQHFMVSASCFCEVFVDMPIAAVPNAPDFLVGLSNVRGVLIPVYQIHTALNISVPKKNIMLVVGKSEYAVGLVIDSLPVSLSLTIKQRESVAHQDNTSVQQLVHEQYFANAYHWLLLNGAQLGQQLLDMASTRKKTTIQAGGAAFM